MSCPEKDSPLPDFISAAHFDNSILSQFGVCPSPSGVDIGAFEYIDNSFSQSISSRQRMHNTEPPVNSLIIYPSISQYDINVRPPTSLNSTHYSIFDTKGKCISTKSYSNSASSQFSIDINDLKAGVYILNMSDDTQRFSAKFIKK